jgi:hypothetical protein
LITTCLEWMDSSWSDGRETTSWTTVFHFKICPFLRSERNSYTNFPRILLPNLMNTV